MDVMNILTVQMENPQMLPVPAPPAASQEAPTVWLQAMLDAALQGDVGSHDAESIYVAVQVGSNQPTFFRR